MYMIAQFPSKLRKTAFKIDTTVTIWETIDDVTAPANNLTYASRQWQCGVWHYMLPRFIEGSTTYIARDPCSDPRSR